MPDAVQPAVLNLNRQKHSAGPQHAKDFRECAFLRLRGFQVVQHQHRDRRGKRFFWKRKRGRIALEHSAISALDSTRDSRRKSMAILDARHAPRAFAQFFRCRARPRANFKNMFSQFRSGQKPRKHLLPRYRSPERRSAKPVLEAIHNITSHPAHRKLCRCLCESIQGEYPPVTLFVQSLIIAGLCRSAAAKRRTGRRCTRKDFRAGGRAH